MRTAYRTHTCGELGKAHVGRTVRLAGWVDATRDHGNLIFIDLRDRYGATQCVFNPAEAPEAHALAEGLRSQDVVGLEGTVVARPAEAVNPRIATGDIEVHVVRAVPPRLWSAVAGPPRRATTPLWLQRRRLSESQTRTGALHRRVSRGACSSCGAGAPLHRGALCGTNR